MKIFLNEYIHPKAVGLLAQNAEIINSFDQVEEIDGIVLRGEKITREIMQKATKLKVIGKHGVGYETIDVAAAKELGITIVYTPGANANAVAELGVGILLDVARKISLGREMVCKDEVKVIAPKELAGVELRGKTLGLVGMGNIAKSIAGILHCGFGMQVIGYDPYYKGAHDETLPVRQYSDLHEMLALADVINVSVPLLDSTVGMIGAAELVCCKPTAILLNTSRGKIVDEAALYESLSTGKLLGAASDVFAQEPPTSENPLFSLPNFVGTPHIGGQTEDAMINMGITVVEDVLRVVRGEAPHNPVN